MRAILHALVAVAACIAVSCSDAAEIGMNGKRWTTCKTDAECPAYKACRQVMAEDGEYAQSKLCITHAQQDIQEKEMKELGNEMKQEMVEMKKEIKHYKEENQPRYVALIHADPDVTAEQGQIKGKVTFQRRAAGGVIVDVELATSFPTATVGHGMHVHISPVDYTGKCASTGAHYDPTKQEGDGYKCDASMPMQCYAGDLTGKHGAVSVQPMTSSSVRYEDPNLNFNDLNDRGVVIHMADGGKPRVACGTIKVAKGDVHAIDTSGGYGQTASHYVAMIHADPDVTAEQGQIKGKVKFQRRAAGGVIVDVELATSFPTATVGHGMHVHVSAVDSTGKCSTAGAHYDPTNQEGDGYKCDASMPMQCYAGDLTGKHGAVSVQPMTSSSVRYEDPNLNFNDLNDRGVVIHMADGGKPRVACGTIKIAKGDAHTIDTSGGHGQTSVGGGLARGRACSENSQCMSPLACHARDVMVEDNSFTKRFICWESETELTHGRACHSTSQCRAGLACEEHEVMEEDNNLTKRNICWEKNTELEHGHACHATSQCRSGLSCAKRQVMEEDNNLTERSICWESTLLQHGRACHATSQCQVELMCEEREIMEEDSNLTKRKICWAKNTKLEQGYACQSTSQCQAGLTCKERTVIMGGDMAMLRDICWNDQTTTSPVPGGTTQEPVTGETTQEPVTDGTTQGPTTDGTTGHTEFPTFTIGGTQGPTTDGSTEGPTTEGTTDGDVGTTESPSTTIGGTEGPTTNGTEGPTSNGTEGPTTTIGGTQGPTTGNTTEGTEGPTLITEVPGFATTEGPTIANGTSGTTSEPTEVLLPEAPQTDTNATTAEPTEELLTPQIDQARSGAHIVAAGKGDDKDNTTTQAIVATLAVAVTLVFVGVGVAVVRQRRIEARAVDLEKGDGSGYDFGTRADTDAL